jgi:hypothetical protein
VKQHHDIVLPGALSKDLNPGYAAIANVYAEPSRMTSANSFLKSFQGIQEVIRRNAVKTSGYFYEDSDKFRSFSVDATLKRSQLYGPMGISMDGGYFGFERVGLPGHTNGVRYGATFYVDGWAFRLGANHFEDFTEMVPRITYTHNYGGNALSFEWAHQSAIFYTNSLAVYEERISNDHFQLSDNFGLEWGNIWAAIEANFYSDENTAVIPQFDFEFLRQDFFDDGIRYALALEGWYMFNTEPSDLYYSPSSYDSTLLRINPSLKLYGDIWLLAFAGGGYSSSTDATLYRYGLKIADLNPESLQFSAGCMQSNDARSEFGFSPDFHYIECNAELGYSW